MEKKSNNKNLLSTKLIYLLVFSAFCLNRVYLINSKFTLDRLILIFVIIIMAFDLSLMNKKLKVKTTTKSIIFWIIILVIYRFYIDMFLHKVGFIQSIYEVLKNILPLLILLVFDNIIYERRKIINTIYYASFIQIFFASIQIFKPEFTISNILSGIPFLSGSKISASYILEQQRITGTSILSIGLGIFLGIFIIISLFRYYKTKKYRYLVILVIYFVLILFTRTRSAIYGVFPSILFGYVIIKKGVYKKLIIFIIIILLSFFTVIYMENYVTRIIPRGEVALGANTYTKIKSNYFGAKYVINNNLFFGAPKHSYYKIVKEASRGENLSDLDLIFTGVTPVHNILGRYFIYYGIIGIILFTILLYHIFKKIMNKKDKSIKFLLFVSLIYFLQYSLLHNSQLLRYLFIWIFLSMGSENS